MSNLHIILSDQLSHDISSLKNFNKETDHILMCENKEEATYVKHHKKKLVFLLSAMRHFAQELKEKGLCLTYIKMEEECRSWDEAVSKILKKHKFDKIVITFPGEYRLLKIVENWQNKFNVKTEILEDDRFICSNSEFATWAKGKKTLRMEMFYREMRRKHNILMSFDKPEGGEWNYDKENRKNIDSKMFLPKTFSVKPDAIVEEIIKIVEEKFKDHFGDIHPFHFAVTRKQALEALDKFIKERLYHFGDYQDAMLQGEPWLYHSHISFYMNCGLLSPIECIRRAEKAYYDGKAPLNSVEGFIRQILGWREYVRGVYWFKMPEYANENFFDAETNLPEFYWTAETKMNCLKQCISETKKNAYAHHIQRLMVLGNFALIAGIDPKQVNEWYLIVYADAYEWVELPNVSGMILFADGGYLASKPYAAGGSYINKMSDYCKKCQYNVNKKEGEDACPFNYLYWDFLERNRSKLQNNHRIGMMYKIYDKMDEDKKKDISLSSKRFLKSLN